MQELYHWQLAGADVADIIEQFLVMPSAKNIEIDYFTKLLRGVVTELDTVDGAFIGYLDRPLEELNPVELAIIRLASYELVYCQDVPYRVVIDEALKLTKLFGAEAGHKYVNGVLDKVAKQILSGGQ